MCPRHTLGTPSGGDSAQLACQGGKRKASSQLCPAQRYSPGGKLRSSTWHAHLQIKVKSPLSTPQASRLFKGRDQCWWWHGAVVAVVRKGSPLASVLWERAVSRWVSISRCFSKLLGGNGQAAGPGGCPEPSTARH